MAAAAARLTACLALCLLLPALVALAEEGEREEDRAPQDIPVLPEDRAEEDGENEVEGAERPQPEDRTVKAEDDHVGDGEGGVGGVEAPRTAEDTTEADGDKDVIEDSGPQPATDRQVEGGGASHPEDRDRAAEGAGASDSAPQLEGVSDAPRLEDRNAVVTGGADQVRESALPTGDRASPEDGDSVRSEDVVAAPDPRAAATAASGSSSAAPESSSAASGSSSAAPESSSEAPESSVAASGSSSAAPESSSEAPESSAAASGSSSAAPESSAEAGEPSSSRSATQWFRLGVDAYLAEDWSTCSRALENALAEWHHFRRANIACRLRCAAEARAAPPLYKAAGDDLDDGDDAVDADLRELRHGEELVRATLCIMKCKRKAFRGRATPDALPAAEQKVFRDLKPYEYLQLCYFQTSQLQKAASAVFTILSHNPDNEIMKNNLKYYLSTPDIQNVVNYESEKYAELFLSGIDAYYAEDYSLASKKLEASIFEFFQAINECRADCEGPFDQGWLPDFTSSVANHFVFCLKCKARCPSKLSLVNGERHADFLPSHYNYLQFAYYKKGKLREAIAAASTYLLFFPTDETMLENVDYYRSSPKVESSMFQPRQEAVNYIKRHSYEDLLLKYIADEFVFTDNHEKELINQPEEIIMKDTSQSVFVKRDTAQEEPHFKTNFERDHKSLKSMFDAVRDQSNTVVTKTMETEVHKQDGPLCRERGIGKREEKLQQEMKETDRRASLQDYNPVREKPALENPLHNFQGEGFLGGAQRFLVDGLADTRECQELIWLAKAIGVRGDGYDGNKSPHSSQEIFEGVTLGRAALMVYFGLIEVSTLNLYLNLSERGRKIVASYFNLPINDLHFTFTHLVCRSSQKENLQNNTYLSHDIHADNCLLLRDGVCEREDPAYFWRDYSAILYLNDNFEGGEFIFSTDPSGQNIESSIKPACGRLVGFSSGKENLHGVRGVRQGSRCALALWFTLDPNHKEWGRKLTEELLQNLAMGNQPQKQVLEDLHRFVQFDLEDARRQMSKVASPPQFQQNISDRAGLEVQNES